MNYHGHNFYGDLFVEVFNSNDKFCPAWTEEDPASHFVLKLSKVLVPDLNDPDVTPHAFSAELSCSWRGSDLYYQLERLEPTDFDYECVAPYFQPLPQGRLHVMRLGLNSWHDTLEEGMTVYADFDYAEQENGKHTFVLDRYGVLIPAPRKMPEALKVCEDIGYQVCGRLQACTKLIDTGETATPDPIPEWCPEARGLSGREAYQEKCEFFLSYYGTCTC